MYTKIQIRLAAMRILTEYRTDDDVSTRSILEEAIRLLDYLYDGEDLHKLRSEE
jgi:hypothetical protein